MDPTKLTHAAWSDVVGALALLVAVPPISAFFFGNLPKSPIRCETSTQVTLDSYRYQLAGA